MVIVATGHQQPISGLGTPGTHELDTHTHGTPNFDSRNDDGPMQQQQLFLRRRIGVHPRSLPAATVNEGSIESTRARVL